MRIVKHTGSFERLLKVFRREISSRSSVLPLRPIQKEDLVFGQLNTEGLIPIIHSEMSSIATSRARLESVEQRLSPRTELLHEILTDCLTEASMTEFVAAMMCSRCEIREGYMLVAPSGTCALANVSFDNKTLYSFFFDLQRIMSGDEVFPLIPTHKSVRGQVVGRVIDPVTKQLVILNHKILDAYGASVAADDEQLSIHYIKCEHWRWLANKYIIKRMNIQLGIISKIIYCALLFEGFDTQLALEFTLDNSGYNLKVNPDWNIVVEHSQFSSL